MIRNRIITIGAIGSIGIKDLLSACALGQCKRLDIAIFKYRCEPNN